MAEDLGQSGAAGGEEADFDRRQFLTASGVVGAAFLAGVGVGTTMSGSSLLGDGEDGNPIKIGAVYGQSGHARSIGRGTVPAVKLAVKDVNDAGGIDDRKVELRVQDHGSNPTQTLRDHVEEFGADVLMGLTSSAVGLDAAPTIESLGVPLVLTDVSTPYLTEFDADTYGDYYASDGGQAAVTPNVFRTNPNTSINTYAMAQFAHESLDVTRVANLGPDTPYGRQAWEYFKAYANGLGTDYDYVASQFPPLGASDMSAQIDTVLDADPDLVFTSFWAADVVTFVRQATERGLFSQVEDVFDTLGADPRVFEELGGAMPEGVHYSTWYWHSAFDNQPNHAFLDDWEVRYRLAYRVSADESVVDLPPFAAASTWAAVHLYKQVIEAAGTTDAGAVVAELEGATFEADPRGPTTIDPESHQATAPAVIGETSGDSEVPYDGVGLEAAETYTLDRSTATDLLAESDLPPGV